MIFDVFCNVPGPQTASIKTIQVTGPLLDSVILMNKDHLYISLIPEASTK